MRNFDSLEELVKHGVKPKLIDDFFMTSALHRRLEWNRLPWWKKLWRRVVKAFVLVEAMNKHEVLGCIEDGQDREAIQARNDRWAFISAVRKGDISELERLLASPYMNQAAITNAMLSIEMRAMHKTLKEVLQQNINLPGIR